MEVKEEDLSLLHYAVGLLMGLAHKYDVIDIVIYHNSIRVRIDQIKEKEDASG